MIRKMTLALALAALVQMPSHAFSLDETADSAKQAWSEAQEWASARYDEAVEFIAPAEDEISDDILELPDTPEGWVTGNWRSEDGKILVINVVEEPFFVIANDKKRKVEVLSSDADKAALTLKAGGSTIELELDESNFPDSILYVAGKSGDKLPYSFMAPITLNQLKP